MVRMVVNSSFSKNDVHYLLLHQGTERDPLQNVASEFVYSYRIFCHTVMVISFWTDRSEQTVQTQIRLLLEEQSDQGLHCLLNSVSIIKGLNHMTGKCFISGIEEH